MAKLFLRDVGSYPERDLEVTLFKDGELQFESNIGKYVHINITREGARELLNFLEKEISKIKSVRHVPRTRKPFGKQKEA